MSQSLELERTFLAKYIPSDLDIENYTELIDVYFPKSAVHPNLRVRKKGNTFEITKKEFVGDNASEQLEHTIVLTEEEFAALAALDGKKVSKHRYIYRVNGKVAEIDIFTGDLAGLVLIDFEFNGREGKEAFVPPDFCLKEVTEETMLAGGMLAGKSYHDIESLLKQLGYKKIT